MLPLSAPDRARSHELSGRTQSRLSVLGVRVDRLSLHDVLRLTALWVAEARAQRARGEDVRTRQIVTLNPEIVIAARRDPDLRALIGGADLVLVDGVGIVLAARLRRVRGLVRLTGADTVEALAACAASTGWRLYLLGARPGVADRAGQALAARHPGLQVGGTYAGSSLTTADAETARRIRDTAADIVCVAYGAPAQECWIARNREALGAAVAVGVGGTFDYLAGRVPRAPATLRRAGLEWAYRLWREPWRWRRMLALPRFALMALAGALPLGWLRHQQTRGG
jgi:N-acetylglucosaminyldiphosphoundecaprenol N-acetyl-beta-D-mannosaminyltransferase